MARSAHFESVRLCVKAGPKGQLLVSLRCHRPDPAEITRRICWRTTQEPTFNRGSTTPPYARGSIEQLPAVCAIELADCFTQEVSCSSVWTEGPGLCSHSRKGDWLEVKLTLEGMFTYHIAERSCSTHCPYEFHQFHHTLQV